MLTWLKKHFAVVALALLLILLAVAWFAPAATSRLSIVFLIFIFTITAAIIIQINREQYLQGKLSRSAFVRKTGLEIAGVLLAILLGAWAGSHIANLALGWMHDAPIRFVAGVLVAFVAGTGIGFLVSKVWNKLLKSH